VVSEHTPLPRAIQIKLLQKIIKWCIL
jgi:hypothetical protein